MTDINESVVDSVPPQIVNVTASTQLTNIAQYVYETIKKTYKEAKDATDTSLIIDLLAKIAVQVQFFRLGSRNLTSVEKETVAIMAGRLWLVSVKGADSPVVSLYDLSAPSVLTAAIDLSKKINTSVRSLSCCKSS